MLLGVGAIIPGYIDLSIHYDTAKISYNDLKESLFQLNEGSQVQDVGSLVRIPICYEAPFSIDMEWLMEYTELQRDAIVKLHTSTIYQVHMLGFVPGFFYLGGLDARLHCPRKKNPRLKIEAGSVGIAGSQTGVYPLESPGGWQLIGKTPVQIFDKNRRDNPFFVQQGDRVQFYEIDRETYNEFAT